MLQRANSNAATKQASIRLRWFLALGVVFGSMTAESDAQLKNAQLRPIRHVLPVGNQIKRIPSPSATLANQNDFVSHSSNVEEIHHDKMVHKAAFSDPDGGSGHPMRDSVTAGARDLNYPWTYQLKNLSYHQFEAKLAEIWGDRLLGTSLDSEQRALRIFFPEGITAPESSMTFDRVTGRLTYEGAPNRKKSWHELMQSIDRIDQQPGAYAVKVIDISAAEYGVVQQVSALFQDDQDETDSIAIDPRSVPIELLRQEVPDFDGKIEIRISPDTNTLILRGKKEDVEKIRAFIFRVLGDPTMIGTESARITLFNSTAEELQEKIQTIYDEQFSQLHGEAIIDSIPGINSLLVVGKKSAIEAVKKLVKDVDGEPTDPIDPTNPDQQRELTPREKGYKKFTLKYISATEAEQAVLALFAQLSNNNQAEPGQSLPVRTIADIRSNSLTVIGSQTLIRRAEALINDIDVGSDQKKAVRVFKVFPIKNHSAADFHVILQDMLNGGQQQNLGFSESQLNVQQNQNLGQQQNDNRPVSSQANLRFVLPDGSLTDAVDFFDVRINSDAASNTITVQAPAEAMSVIEQIINTLDQLPDINSEVKVFPIVHGDASEVLATLDTIFTGGQQQQGGGAGQQTGSLSDLPLQSPGSDGASLVNIRFAVGERTNTIIAAGSAGDLEFVEALIYRLDEKNVRDRTTVLYRLNNASVLDVSAAINDWLTQLETINGTSPITGAGPNNTGVNLARQDVIVVPEESSNSLIVNARSEYLEEIELVINRLDRRPPMVKVKAMIVLVNLNQLENYGVEFGIQDSSIFDAGLSNTIGTGFIGLDNPAGQIVTDLGVGRASAAAGVGGFVLSAGDESLNFILRLLKQKGCANVLFAPEIMTLENLEGRLNQGASIQRAGAINQIVGGGIQQSFIEEQLGITLAITPRVSPDGMIVMFVDVQNRSLGSAADGTIIGTDSNGNAIVSRPINQVVAQTTIMARSGQTVAISGLIQEEKSQTVTSVPFLGDLPVIGPLFQTVENTADRTELLIILTPYVVDGADDISALNKDEMDRMHWCACDVAEAYGETSYQGIPYREQPTATYYPDNDPRGAEPQFQSEKESQPRSPAFNEQLNLDDTTEQVLPQNDGWQDRQQGSGSRNSIQEFNGDSGMNHFQRPRSGHDQGPDNRQLRTARMNNELSGYDPHWQSQPDDVRNGYDRRPFSNPANQTEQPVYHQGHDRNNIPQPIPNRNQRRYQERSDVTFERPPVPQEYQTNHGVQAPNRQIIHRRIQPDKRQNSGQYARQNRQQARPFGQPTGNHSASYGNGAGFQPFESAPNGLRQLQPIN